MTPNIVKRRKPLMCVVEGDTARVTIAGQQVLMDAADTHLLDGWTLSVTTAGYVLLSGSYKCRPMQKRYLHRHILSAINGVDVDHVSGDTLDNRRINLRICTRSDNLQNGKRHSDGKSPYKGVYYSKNQWDDKKWLARICHKGVNYYLGAFLTPEEAASAYNDKARELCGVFARVNRIDGTSDSVSVMAGTL
jgi:hypothetical protein